MGRATLLLVMGFIVIVSLTLNRMSEVTKEASFISSALYEEKQAQLIAHSAVEQIISYHIQSRVTDTTLTASDYLGGSANGSMQLLGQNDSTNMDSIQVNVTALYSDAVCSTEAFFQTVNAYTLNMPTITSAMAFYSPNANLIMRSHSGLNGNDTNMDGTPGPGAALPGVAATGAISVTMNAGATISGAPPSPTPATATGTWQELADMAESYEPFAHYHYSGDQVISGETYGSAANPVIVYFDADAKFTAATVGYGILVIRGDMKVTSHFTWYGLVIVSGVSSAEVEDTADSNIFGALLLGAEVSTGDIKSHSAVAYSTEALNMVMNSLVSTGGGVGSKGPRRIVSIQWWE